MADKKMTQVADPGSAIASYLDELLHTATDSALHEEPEPPKPVARERTRIAPKPAPIVARPVAEAKSELQKPVTPAPVAEIGRAHV